MNESKSMSLRSLAQHIAALANDEKDKAAQYHLTCAAGAIDEYADACSTPSEKRECAHHWSKCWAAECREEGRCTRSQATPSATRECQQCATKQATIDRLTLENAQVATAVATSLLQPSDKNGELPSYFEDEIESHATMSGFLSIEEAKRIVGEALRATPSATLMPPQRYSIVLANGVVTWITTVDGEWVQWDDVQRQYVGGKS